MSSTLSEKLQHFKIVELDLFMTITFRLMQILNRYHKKPQETLALVHLLREFHITELF